MAGIIAVFASGCTFLPQRGGGDLGLKGGYNPPLAAGGLIITKGNDGVTEILSDQFTVPSADFSKTGVVTGDVLVILAGSNRGQYTINEISKITLVVEGLGSQTREPGLAYEVRGSRIYFSGIDGYVYALGGTVLTKEAELLQAGGLAAPGDTTVFGSAEPDGFIYAIDPLTLSPKQESKLGWRRPEGKDRTLLPLVAAPVLDRASNTLLVGSEDGNLYAYDAVTGEERSRFVYGSGCTMCAQTGYRGRTGVFELLPMTDTIKEMFLEEAPRNRIWDQAVKDGIAPISTDGMDKVKKGITTPYEVMRISFSL